MALENNKHLTLKQFPKPKYMKTILLLVGVLFTVSVHAQPNKISDSLLYATCTAIKDSKQPTDSMKIGEAFNELLGSVFSTIKDSITYTKTFDYLYVRLQKLCPAFKKYLDDINPPKDDWTPLDSQPASKMDKKSCREFLNHKSYYYFDQSGDTVNLSLSNNYWIDHFKDGTYSKLRFNWVNDQEFEISFIESTNKIRKNLSKPGEKYKYALIEKFPTYYLVFLNMKEFSVMGTFKLFYR